MQLLFKDIKKITLTTSSLKVGSKSIQEAPKTKFVTSSTKKIKLPQDPKLMVSVKARCKNNCPVIMRKTTSIS